MGFFIHANTTTPLSRTTSTIVLSVAIVLSCALLFLWRDAIVTVSDFFIAQKAYSADNASYDSSAVLLASLEYGTSSPTERQVALFSLLLDTLHGHCVAESREAIARALVTARRDARNENRAPSIKTTMQTAQGLVPKTPPGSGSCVAAIEAIGLYRSL